MCKIFCSVVCISLLNACNQTKDTNVIQSSNIDSLSLLAPVQDTIAFSTPEEQLTEAAESIYERFFAPGTKLYIVSTEGSALHTEPREGSEVLSILPFRDSVIVEQHPFSVEEIKAKHNEYGKTFWIKIKGERGEGYIVSRDVILSRMKNINSQAHLLLASTGCVNNYVYRSDFRYYGIFDSDREYVRKEIQPEFSGMHEPWEGLVWDGYTIRVRGNEKSQPLFIFGLPKILKEGTIKQSELLPIEGEVEREIALQDGMTLSVAKFGSTIHLTFYSAARKEIQVLEFQYLNWCGDLDGDGKIDFVYSRESGELSGVSIALSSMAEDHQVVKEVFTFGIGLCC
jgi:hypothetical protein